jgi:hypothetical protein
MRMNIIQLKLGTWLGRKKKQRNSFLKFLLAQSNYTKQFNVLGSNLPHPYYSFLTTLSPSPLFFNSFQWDSFCYFHSYV